MLRPKISSVHILGHSPQASHTSQAVPDSEAKPPKTWVNVLAGSYKSRVTRFIISLNLTAVSSTGKFHYKGLLRFVNVVTINRVTSGCNKMLNPIRRPNATI
jgi:hypothetical protein